MPFRSGGGGGIDLTGRWFEAEPMPTARSGIRFVPLRGLIYAIGGFDGVQWRGDVEAYDPSSGSWFTRAPLPTPRDSFGAAVVRGRIHVVGGNGAEGPVLTHEVYDPETDSWSVEVAPPAPARFYTQALAAYGRLFLIGGYDGTQAVPSVYSWAPGSANWVQETPLAAGRYLFGATVAARRLYVVAGREAAPVRTVLSYDPTSRTWRSEPTLLRPAQDQQAVTLGGRVHVLGGQGFRTDHLELDAATNRWLQRAPLPIGRDQFGAAAAGDRIYVAGGYREGEYLRRLDIFTPLGG